MKRILPVISMLCALCLVASVRKSASEADRRAKDALVTWLAVQSEGAVGAAEDPTFGMGMLEVASSLDPDDPDVAGSLARTRVVMSYFDANEVPKLLRDISGCYLAHPEDILLGKLSLRFIKYLGSDSVITDMTRWLHLNHPTDPELALEYAQAMASRNSDGDIDSALAIVNPILAAGIDPSLSYYKARLLAAKGDTAAVSLTLREMIAEAPADAEVLSGVASFYDYIDLLDSAYYYNVRACEVDSTYGPALLGIAQHSLDRGDTIAFENYLERSLLTSSMDWEVKQRVLSTFLSARAARDTAYTTIFPFLQRLTRVNPTEPSIYMMRGLLYRMRDSIPQAFDDLRRVVDLDPETADGYRMLGSLQAEQGDTTEAVSTFLQGLELTGDPTLGFAAAMWDLTRNRPAQGLKDLDAIPSLDALNKAGKATYYSIKGDLYYANNMPQQAIAALDSSLMFDPANFGVYNNAAYYRALAGEDLDLAERYARTAVTGDLGNPTYLDTYAWVLFKQKNFPAARIQIDLALDAYSSFNDSVIIDQDTVAAEFDFADPAAFEAVETLESEAVPQVSAEVYDHAGDIYFMVGEPAQALVFWQKALMLAPDDEKIKKKVDNKTYFPDETF